MNAFIGIKQNQSQAFLEDGTRVPVTRISALPMPVVLVKTVDKDGYSAIQIGLGTRKKVNKAVIGQIRGAKLETSPRFFREIKLSSEDALNAPQVGSKIAAADVLKPGDIVDVTAVSKGKGFAGGVKRHHFKGGPRTHGQSDRERAPGSIGQTTTPGRVYKGKRMAGKMGFEKVTVKNVKVVDINDSVIVIKGLVPGGKNGVVVIKKVGEDKKFVGLFHEEVSKEEKVSKVSEGEETQDQPEAQVAQVEASQKEVKEPKEEPQAQKTEAAEASNKEKVEKEENAK